MKKIKSFSGIFHGIDVYFHKTRSIDGRIPMPKTGKIHLYCGNGKGKTTASVGLCVRSLGAGLRVFFAQFIKDGTSSEISFLRAHGGNDFQYACDGCDHFIFGAPSDADRRKAEDLLMQIEAAAASGRFDVVIADEVFGACQAGLLSKAAVLHLMASRKEAVELILTGRNPPEECVKLADLVSEIQCVKHYFNDGRPAERGIEF